MTLDEAIKHCKEKAKEQKNEASSMLAYNEDVEPNRYKTQCLECAKEHEQLADWLEELKARREADRWISVSERLPEYRHAVLVYCPENENVYCAFHDDKHWCVFGSYETVWQRVTHWKPLPKFYESEATNES